jgi:type IV secretory pathway VirB3-like protein
MNRADEHIVWKVLKLLGTAVFGVVYGAAVLVMFLGILIFSALTWLWVGLVLLVRLLVFLIVVGIYVLIFYLLYLQMQEWEAKQARESRRAHGSHYYQQRQVTPERHPYPVRPRVRRR